MKNPERCRVKRGSRISIDLQALKHNFGRVREYAPNSRVMPVVKADAYGHGMLDVAEALDEADAFGVAMLSEAVRLRESGCEKDIVVFHGFVDADELALCRTHRLQPTLHRRDQIDRILVTEGDALTVWLKLDTGMHRLGIHAEGAGDVIHDLQACQFIEQLCLMSHFANADDPYNILNNKQLERLVKVKNTYDVPSSLANSGGICAISESHLDWVRPGIMLYGASPLLDRSAESLGLMPVMTFESSLISIQRLRAGDSIGYGGTWTCPEDMPVGLVSAGYADGYPRHAATGTPVSVAGQRSQILGRVSMDSLCIDLRSVDAELGARVELWGGEVPVDEVARSSGTIAYELLCHAGSGLAMTG